MEKMIQYVLEMNPFIVFFGLMLFAFGPGSCLILIKKLNRWVKSIVVCVCGELSAGALFVLSQSAKAAGIDNILTEFTPIAVILAVLTLVGTIICHLSHWDQKAFCRRT